MGGGGHIVSAPTKQKGASRASVHVQGLCDLAWCAWCRLGGGWTQSSTWTFQQCTKHPWGPVWRCLCVGGQHGGWFSGSWSKLGVWKKCCELNKNPPNAHANPTTPQQIACLCEDLSLWVTQGGVVCMDGVTQKGNSAGGCNVVARASRTEGRPRVVPECPGVGGIMVPSINCLWSPVWRLSACLESGIIYNIPFNMQNPSKIPLKLKLGNSKVPQTTS